MGDRQIRLTKCFLAVFPELSPEEVVTAAPNSVKTWDSVATLTLLTVIEEEFGIEIDFTDLLETLSYEQIDAYLQERIGISKGPAQG